MKKLTKFIKRFRFAWAYAYQTKKWQYFEKEYGLKPRQDTDTPRKGE